MVSVKYFAVFILVFVLRSALAAPNQKRDTSNWTSEERLKNLKDLIDEINSVMERVMDYKKVGLYEEVSEFPIIKSFGDASQKAVNRTQADSKELYDSIEKQVKQGEAFPSVEDIDKSFETILLKNREKLKSEFHQAIEVDEIVKSVPGFRKGLEAFSDTFSILSYKYFGIIFHEKITHPEEIAVISTLDIDRDDITSNDDGLKAKAIEEALEKKHVSKETHDKVIAFVNELSTIFKQFDADNKKAAEKITEYI